MEPNVNGVIPLCLRVASHSPLGGHVRSVSIFPRMPLLNEANTRTITGTIRRTRNDTKNNKKRNKTKRNETAPTTTNLVAGSPDVDSLADLSVELVLEVVDTAVLDDVVRDHRVRHKVPHADAFHPANVQCTRTAEKVHMNVRQCMHEPFTKELWPHSRSVRLTCCAKTSCDNAPQKSLARAVKKHRRTSVPAVKFGSPRQH